MKQSSKARKHSAKAGKKVAAKSRVRRITNVRANANGISGGAPTPGTLQP